MARAKRRKSLFPTDPDWFSAQRVKRSGWLLLLAAVALWLAIEAVAVALKSIALNPNPAAVVRLTGDASAQLRVAQQEAMSAPERLRAPDVVGLAKRAAAQSALQVAPLRMLALHAAADNDAASAARLAKVAERVTRRDLLSQMVLIENAVQANNHHEALRHYDIALRTNAEVRSSLFPVLSAALSDPVIRAAVTPYVNRKANWVPEFILFAMRDGPEGPRRIATLLLESGAGRQAAIMQPVSGTLLGMLVDRNEFAVARRLYAQLPDSKPGLSRNAKIAPATIDPRFGFLAWTPVSSESTGAAFEQPDNPTALQTRVFAAAGERGIVLRRLISLPAGQYYLNETRRAVVATDGQAVWQMTCRNGTTSRVIWSSSAKPLIYRTSRTLGPLIPADCGEQMLELQVAGGEKQEGLEFIINHFDLTR